MLAYVLFGWGCVLERSEVDKRNNSGKQWVDVISPGHGAVTQRLHTFTESQTII